MPVVKLDTSHSEQCRSLFANSSYFSPLKNTVDSENYEAYARCGYGALTHSILYDNYLTAFNENTEVWGLIREGTIVTALCGYRSSEEPAWYLMAWRNTGSESDFNAVLTAMTQDAELNGYCKFYTLESPQHLTRFRQEHMQGDISRYTCVDEFIIPEKHQCMYVYHWEMLFHRLLIPEATIGACYFLKQEHRKVIPNGGSL